MSEGAATDDQLAQLAERLVPLIVEKLTQQPERGPEDEVAATAAGDEEEETTVADHADWSALAVNAEQNPFPRPPNAPADPCVIESLQGDAYRAVVASGDERAKHEFATVASGISYLHSMRSPTGLDRQMCYTSYTCRRHALLNRRPVFMHPREGASDRQGEIRAEVDSPLGHHHASSIRQASTAKPISAVNEELRGASATPRATYRPGASGCQHNSRRTATKANCTSY